jgi:hypothetical protein
VALADEGEFTLLRYTVNAQVGGKIAQLGARLIDATAKQMADAFFDRFTTEVAGPEETGAEGAAGAVAAATQPAPGVSVFSMIPARPGGYPMVVWIGGIIWILILLLIASAYL